MRHKHADCIIAWAEGKDVEVKDSSGAFVPVAVYPSWQVNMEYRIKPEPKPDVVGFIVFHSDGYISGPHSVAQRDDCGFGDLYPQIKIMRDGETGALKSAEVIK